MLGGDGILFLFLLLLLLFLFLLVYLVLAGAGAAPWLQNQAGEGWVRGRETTATHVHQ